MGKDFCGDGRAMMRRSQRRASFGFVLVFTVCALFSSVARAAGDDGTQLSALQTELSKANMAHPEQDVDAALAHGDRRFLAVCGFGCTAPGAESNDVAAYGSRVLEGTSDTIESRAHEMLIRIAARYAENYNKILSSRLKRTAR